MCHMSHRRAGRDYDALPEAVRVHLQVPKAHHLVTLAELLDELVVAPRRDAPAVKLPVILREDGRLFSP